MTVGNTADKVSQFILDLQNALQERRLYGAGHALTAAAKEKALTSLREAMAGRAEITIGVIGGELAFGPEPLYNLTRTAKNLITALMAHKVEKLSFTGDVPPGDMGSFLDLLASGAGAAPADISGMKSIAVSGFGREQTEAAAGGVTAVEAYTEGPRILGDIGQALSNGLPVNTRAANAFIGKVLKSFMDNKTPFLIATSLKRHDEYSFIHSINVAVLSLAQGEALALSKPALAELGLAGFLHDSGKIALTADILRKKGRLSDAEFEKVSHHPLDGAKLLLQTPDLSPMVAAVSFEHHLRYDGKGYPRKVFGKELSLASMIVSISDVYDALRSTRPYREGLAPEVAFKEMLKEGGGLFQPELLEIFFRAIGVYPPGSLVCMDDGSVGIVIAANPSDIRRPVVEVWYESGGVELRQPRVINLLDKIPGKNEYRHTITRSVPPEAGYKIPAKYRMD